MNRNTSSDSVCTVDIRQCIRRHTDRFTVMWHAMMKEQKTRETENQNTNCIQCYAVAVQAVKDSLSLYSIQIKHTHTRTPDYIRHYKYIHIYIDI